MTSSPRSSRRGAADYDGGVTRRPRASVFIPLPLLGFFPAAAGQSLAVPVHPIVLRTTRLLYQETVACEVRRRSGAARRAPMWAISAWHAGARVCADGEIRHVAVGGAQAGLVNGAELLGWDGQIGALEAGYLADVAGDPLQDIGTLQNVSFVMKGGVVYRKRTTWIRNRMLAGCCSEKTEKLTAWLICDL
jgi:hypothetical protein